MGDFCENCKYINECQPKKEHSEIIGCCEFGGFDKDFNLIDDD